MNIKLEQSQTDSTDNSLSIKLTNNNSTFNQKRNFIFQRFIQLKQELKLIKHIRKTQIDSLLKKLKSKLFKTIHNAIKHCIDSHLSNLPQLFITNIKIGTNKYYLTQIILSIYNEHNVFSK